MRLWHTELLPYLPDSHFKGQLRELVAIMHDWRDKGKTNHLLINKVMDYHPMELNHYFAIYFKEYEKRYGKRLEKQAREFFDFGFSKSGTAHLKLFKSWHNKEYLRVCMANLYEKHFMGIGKSRITDDEWARLCEGYEKITGEKYQI